MSGTPLHVSPLAESELPLVLPIWDDLRAQPGFPSNGPATDQVVEILRRRLAASDAAEAAGEAPTYRLFGAYDDGALVGVCSLAVGEPSLFDAQARVQMDLLHVLDGHRGAGVGRALLTAACEFAQTVGACDLVGTSPTQVRGMDRFLARLACTPSAVTRVGSVEALASQLAAPSANPEHSQLQRLLRRRAVIGARSMRAPRVAR